MEKIIHTDVLIAGAGGAGIGAAYGAAACGMKVVVIEKNSFPGGRATASAVGTVCGLYLRSHAEPVFAMHGFPKIFAERLLEITGKLPVKFAEGLWFIPCYPADFEKTAREFLSHTGIQVIYNTGVSDAEVSGGKIISVSCNGEEESLKIIPRSVIDCSGEGVLGGLLQHPVITDKEYQAAAIVFSLHKISVADEFQLGFALMKKITAAIDEKKAPEYFSLISIVPYSLASGEVMLKLGLPWQVNGEDDPSAIETEARQLVINMVNFIRQTVHGFENAEISWIAKEVGVRTGKRVKGKYILSDKDVLHCHKYDDGICNGAWAIEHWRTGNKRVEMTYFKENDFYTIPAGCLESGEIENFFFAGKIISAEEKAIASARVIGTCLGTGYAAGVIAAYYAKNTSGQDAIRYIQQENALHEIK